MAAANPPPIIIDLTASPPPRKVTTTAYKNQATKLLEHTFPRLSCKAISVVLNDADFQFRDAYYVLVQIAAVSPVEANVRNVFQRMPRGVRVFLLHDRLKKKKKRLSIRDPALLEEIDTIPEMNTKENVPPASKDSDETIEDEEERSKDAASLVECGCCYGDYPPKDMHQCAASEGHMCCKECLYRYVSEQLDGNNTIRFPCIVNDACSAIYPTTTLLDKVLTPGLKGRVNDREFRSQVEEAEIEGLWSCPVCAHIGYLDRPYPPTVHCVPCQTEYCRMCKEVAHTEKTCEQVKAERERLKNPIHRAHEAMSRASIRSCPSCGTEFQKYDGCNKMTCPKCRTLSCYLCEQKIEDYSHFCNKQNCPCARCHLWGNAEEKDSKTRRQAGLRALQGADMTPEEIEEVLASPSPKNAKAASTTPVQQPLTPPGVNYEQMVAAMQGAAPPVQVFPAAPQPPLPQQTPNNFLQRVQQGQIVSPVERHREALQANNAAAAMQGAAPPVQVFPAAPQPPLPQQTPNNFLQRVQEGINGNLRRLGLH